MKRLLVISLLATLTANAEEGLRSGHATAQWLVAKQKDGVIETVVRLKVDVPWHVYWYNPGEAGMPTAVELKLPQGWKGGVLRHPVPKKFKTGGLHGFGHEGTVDYGLTLTAPNDLSGNVILQAQLSWLTCNDDACIPGEITLKLKVEDGKVIGPGVDAESYLRIARQFPHHITPIDEVKLRLQEDKNSWELVIMNADQLNLDPAKTEVFVETQELVKASVNVKFEQLAANVWQAKAAKGEFAVQKPDECAILLVQKGKPAVRLEWVRGQ